MKYFIRSIVDRIFTFLVHHPVNKGLIIQQAQEYDRLKEQLRASTPENIALHGYKVYSQNDEDGIIDKIFSVIPGQRTFVEIGIQNGIECNTHNLLLRDWKGVWIEGSKKYVDIIKQDLGGDHFADKLVIVNSFINRDNIVEIVSASCMKLNCTDIDLFSLDIDGNDYYIIEALLQKAVRPKVFCVEYNGKYPPPLKVKIQYDESHAWDRSEYQGASLQSFVDLFQSSDYTLLCCSVVGINAFFIRNDFLPLFKSYPIEDTYVPCRYHLSPIQIGSKPSLRFLRNHING